MTDSTRKLHMYIKPSLCTPCGGKCCKWMPGTYAPEEFGAPHRVPMRFALAKALAEGRVTIDWYERSPSEHRPMLLYVRPAMKGYEGDLRHPAWGGTPCTFLTDTGCELPHDSRPYQCRAMEPLPDGCKSHGGGKWEGALPWKEYQDTILLAEKMAKQLKKKKAGEAPAAP